MSQQSVDTSVLAGFYAPFQSPSSQGWTDSPEPSVFFVSQGSEYKLREPWETYYAGAATGDVRKSLDAFVGKVVDALSGYDQTRSLADSLSAWLAQVDAGAAVDQMTVNTELAHIRNQQGDDTATLTLVYVFCPPLAVGLLMQVTVHIDWAGTADDTNEVINLYELADSELDDPLGAIPGLLEILGLDAAVSCIEVASAVALVLVCVDLVGTAIIDFADDGGRVNFLTVIAHAIHRISASTTPVPDEGGKVLSIDPERLGIAWYHTSKESTVSSDVTPYMEGVFFGTYPDDGWNHYHSLEYRPDSTAPYIVGMPEMSWGTRGRSTLVTAKVFTGWAEQATDVYCIFFMLFGATGELLAVSSAVQGSPSSKSMAMPDPAWTSADDLDGYGTTQVPQELDDLGTPDAWAMQLTYVLPQLMTAIRDASSITDGDWRTALQPAPYWAVDWSDTAQFDTGENPSVTVRGDGRVIDSHSDGGLSRLYANHGSIDGSGTVSWAGEDGIKYDSGDWPSVAVLPGNNASNVLEIHSGGSNDIWWEYASLNSDGHPSFSGGQAKIGNGDHPALSLRADGVFVEMHTGWGGLLYGTGYFDGRTGLSMTATDQGYVYSGDYATVAALEGGTVIAVHNDQRQIWFNLGTYQSDSTIAWQNNSPPFGFTLDGNHPHLAVTSDDRVVLTYDNDGQVLYALGEMVSGKLVWHLLNGSVCSGETPALAVTPQDGVMMVYASGGNLWYATGTPRGVPIIGQWPASALINSADTTIAAPAACAFGGRLYVFWQGGNQGLFVSASADGRTWPSGKGVQPGALSPAYPAACVLGGEMFLFWKGTDAGGTINYCTTTDGHTWSGIRTIAGTTTSASPAACVFQDRLYVFWPDSGSTAYVRYSVYDPDTGFSSPNALNGFDYTSAAVAACEVDSKLCVYFRQGDSSGHHLYVSASPDGASWPHASRIDESTWTAPAACADGSMAYLFWTSDDASKIILYSASQSGTVWPRNNPIDAARSSSTPSSAESGCVGATVFGDRVYLFWKNSSGHIAFSSASA